MVRLFLKMFFWWGEVSPYVAIGFANTRLPPLACVTSMPLSCREGGKGAVLTETFYPEFCLCAHEVWVF